MKKFILIIVIIVIIILAIAGIAWWQFGVKHAPQVKDLGALTQELAR